MSADNSPENVEPEPKPVKYCTFADFTKVELRVAEIITAEDHPNADKLLKLTIRLGERTKQICAGLKGVYEPEALVGKRIIVVDNLEPRKLRGEVSEGMLLAAREEGTGRLSLVITDAPDIQSGSEVS